MPAGGTLKIGESATLEESLVLDKDMTVDLNGKTLTKTGNSVAIVADNGADITLKNGTVNAQSHAVIAVGDSTVTIESGNYNSSNDTAIWAGSNSGEVGHVVINGGSVTSQEFAVGAMQQGSSIEINGGIFTARDNAVIAGNGTRGWGGTDIVINDGTFIGGIQSSGYIACGIYQPQDGTLTVNGGTFRITNGVGILVRAGQVEVNGGTIITTGDVQGKVGDSRVLADCSAVYVDGAAKYPEWSGCSVVLNDGTFTTDDGVRTVTITVPEGEDPHDRLTINGGTYSGDIDF